mgnify:CR=1 FL=1
MKNNITSTVAFRSNLQPVTGSYETDHRFLSAIHDPFALEDMKKRGFNTVTPIQSQEYQHASLHCAYAFPDDYPFGTVIDENGKEHVVCKCTNIQCSRFSSCRLDFDPAELVVSENNVYFVDRIKEILTSSAKKPDKNSQEGDSLAAAVAFSATPQEKKDVDVQDITDVPEIPVITDIGKHTDEKTAEVSFESFVEVQQEDIIMLDPTERTVVNAGPGTGKTWTLIEKIKYMLTEAGTEPENILVLCFSRAAVEVVRTRLEISAEKDELPLNWHEIEVRTFDSFATYLLAWLQENKPDLLPDKYSLESESYDQRIKTATSSIRKFEDILAGYKHVIIDEVQDLVGVRAELVLELLHTLPDTCGFTILGDSCQALYDYLSENDNSVMDSAKFYEAVFANYTEANYYTLAHNYRQGDSFGTYTVPYRNAILLGDAEARTKEAAALNENLPMSSVNLKNFSASDAIKFRKNGTLGILTRTNGQALKISSWLRSVGVEHLLQKPSNSNELGAWIVRILTSAETDVISEDEFNTLFSTAYPEKGDMAIRYWNALVSTQRDQTKRHYEIEDLLRGLTQNARNPLLFEEPTDKQYEITVSNIHRAKGREFDTVLVLEDVLKAMADEENDDLLEHKVCYVALTRPKKLIEKVDLKTQYIYISKDEIRRCFMAGGFANKKYLSHFEVGDSSDINNRSSAESDALQIYLQNIPADTRLKLLKCPEDTEKYVVYRIVPEDDERIVLGYTTSFFAKCMERAIQRIYKNDHTIAYKYFPNIFGEIYFDGLNTCISASGDGLVGAKSYGGMSIWYGFKISGFAQIEKDRY